MNSLYGYIISNYSLDGTSQHIIHDILWYASEILSDNGDLSEEGLDLIDMTISDNIGMCREEIEENWRN